MTIVREPLVHQIDGEPFEAPCCDGEPSRAHRHRQASTAKNTEEVHHATRD